MDDAPRDGTQDVPPNSIEIPVSCDKDNEPPLSLRFNSRRFEQDGEVAFWWELDDASAKVASPIERLVDPETLKIEVGQAEVAISKMIEALGLEVPKKRRRLPDAANAAIRGTIENFFRYEWGGVAVKLGGAQSFIDLVERALKYKFLDSGDQKYNNRAFLYSTIFRLREIIRDLNKYKAKYRRRDELPDPSRYASDPVNRSKVDVALRTSPELRDMFDEAAKAQELNRTDWILMHLEKALEAEGFDAKTLIPPRGRGSKPIEADDVPGPTPQ